ncbi:hypothetical protein R1sor_015868 [Riccia sorocarpa]|uniref:Uncharacterized protein n=1 Tax=Riccia sorocarpa TaxID=122646 RepID=A0ABD3HHE5_9MARC
MSRRDPYEFAPPQPPVQVDSDGNSDHRSYETTQKALPGSNVYGGKTILVKTWLKAKVKMEDPEPVARSMQLKSKEQLIGT